MKRSALVLVASILFLACQDIGTSPEPQALSGPVFRIEATGWIQTPGFAQAHSRSFNSITVQPHVNYFPDSLRTRLADSIKIVILSDGNATYVEGGLSGGYENGTTRYASYFKRFYFPPGYVNRFPLASGPVMNVYVKYN